MFSKLNAYSGLRLPGQRRLRFSAGVAILCLTGGGAAAQVLIDPVVVEFGARQRIASVSIRLSDKALAPIRLQADVLRWGQNLKGDALTESSNELLVTPPIAELQPGQKQLFRVALRGARPAPEELAYRLIFEDVAEPTESTSVGQGMSIKFRMRYDLPLLLAPTGPVVNVLRWKPCPLDAALAPANAAAAPAKPGASEACIRLINAGNRRVKVQTLTLAGEGWEQMLTLQEGENVLVGTEREWRVPLQTSQTGALRGVQVQTARGETLQAEAGGF